MGSRPELGLRVERAQVYWIQNKGSLRLRFEMLAQKSVELPKPRR